MQNKAFFQILVVIIIIGGGILAWQYFGIPKDQTADWKTYRNEEYSFEMKYPAYWYVKEEYRKTGQFEWVHIKNKEDVNIVTPGGPHGSIFEINPTLIEYDCPKPLVDQNIGGVLFKCNQEYSDVLFDCCSKKLRITAYTTNDLERENNEQIFNQILSTFKFLD